MRTNIVIDEKLLSEAFALSDARTKKDLIHEALRTLVSFKRRKDLTELFLPMMPDQAQAQCAPFRPESLFPRR
jgi:hypothetical protein